MDNFVAIDFETANEQASSVCSIGIVVVKDGKMIDSFYGLIKPEPNYYKWFCQQVHGLCHCDTDSAPIFPNVWQQIDQKIREYYPECNVPFVAHNKRFDESCLKAVFQTYQMDYPNYQFYFVCCTAAFWKEFAESSVTYCFGSLWICFRKSSPRTCRC